MSSLIWPDYEFVAPVATRLADRRKAAVEAKIDAELALGRHASVLSQLNELVARDPLNERLHGQRIIALYRCGRPSDALRPTTSYGASSPTSSASIPARRCSGSISRCSPRSGAGAGIRPPTARPRSAAAEIGTTGHNRACAAPPSTTVAAHAVARRCRHPRGRGRGRHSRRCRLSASKPKHTLAALPPNSIGILDADGSLRDAVPGRPDPGRAGVRLRFAVGREQRRTHGATRQSEDPRGHPENLEVGSNPTAIALSARDVWVANGADGSVTEIDAATSRRGRHGSGRGAAGRSPLRSEGVVWVANSGDDNLVPDRHRFGQCHRRCPGWRRSGRVARGRRLCGSPMAPTARSPTSTRVPAGQWSDASRADAGAAGCSFCTPKAPSGLPTSRRRASPRSIHRPDSCAARFRSGDGPSSLAASPRCDLGQQRVRRHGQPNRSARPHRRRPHLCGRCLAITAWRSPGSDLWLTSAAFANASHRGRNADVRFGSDARFLKLCRPATAYNLDFGIADATGVRRSASPTVRPVGPRACAIVPDLAVALPTVTNGAEHTRSRSGLASGFSNGDVVHAVTCAADLFAS